MFDCTCKVIFTLILDILCIFISCICVCISILLAFKAVLEFKDFMPILNCKDVLFVTLVWKAKGWNSSWNWYHAKAIFLCMAFRISWRNVHQINSECFVCVAGTAQVRKSPTAVGVCMAFHTPFPAGRMEVEWAPPARLCSSQNPVGGRVLVVLCGAASWLTFRKLSFLSTLRNHSFKYLLELQLVVTLS